MADGAAALPLEQVLDVSRLSFGARHDSQLEIQGSKNLEDAVELGAGIPRFNFGDGRLAQSGSIAQLTLTEPHSFSDAANEVAELPWGTCKVSHSPCYTLERIKLQYTVERIFRNIRCSV